MKREKKHKSDTRCSGGTT